MSRQQRRAEEEQQNNLEQASRTLCTYVSSGEEKHQKLRFRSVINSHLEITHVLKSFIYSQRIRRFGTTSKHFYSEVYDIQNGSVRYAYLIVSIIRSSIPHHFSWLVWGVNWPNKLLSNNISFQVSYTHILPNTRHSVIIGKTKFVFLYCIVASSHPH